MLSPFLQRVARGPLLADGAMGTVLYTKGVSYERCFEELNVSQPTLVQAIHEEYIAAGADLIETNSFGGNRYRLAQHGMAGDVRRFNRRAASIARQAREVSGQSVFIAGSVGPLGLPLAPVGTITLQAARYAFREQIEALLEGGVDLILIETMTELASAREALLAAREACDLPVIVNVTFSDDGLTVAGEDGATVARTLRDLGADMVGVNCSVGPQKVFEVIEAMHAAGESNLVAMPNAGLPTRYDGRYFYISTPDYFGEYVPQFLQAGVALLGGCCGTTPQHVAAMRAAMPQLAEVEAAHQHSRIELVSPSKPTEAPPAADQPPTRFAEKLAAGECVISVEMTPPRGINPTKMLQGAAMLREMGTDLVNIPDNATAHMRMSCLGAANLIQQRTGMEAIIHCTPRDRNLLALQSDLLGAHANGTRNILSITGDPLHNGSYANSASVWEVDAIGLVAILKNMNAGKDAAGSSIGDPAHFFIGVGANPTAEDPVREMERFHAKVEAGAQFVMLQPVYDPAVLRDWLDEARRVVGAERIPPILVGVMPLQSYRNAEYVHNEVPGIIVPEVIRERMRVAGEHGLQAGIAMAQEFVSQTWDWGQGVYIMPAFGRYEIAGEVIKIVREQQQAAQHTFAAATH